MRSLLLASLAIAVARPVLAQTPDSAAGPVLSLQEAIDLARRNNPTHLQTRSARARAGAALRSSYGAFLPTISSSFGAGFREGRAQFFGGQQFGSNADVVSTDAGIDINAQYSVATLLGPKVQRANLDAAEADIASSEATLRSTVVTQYLAVLRAQARAQLQDTLLASAQAQLELARARESVGAATTLDVRRAEVGVGQQRVGLLRERNNVEIEKLRLFQQLGVQQPANVRLTSEFPVTEPQLNLDELLATARRANPALEATRAREKAAGATVRQAQSAYTPTLALSTSYGGYTSQQSDFDDQIAETRAGFEGRRASCYVTDSLRVGAGLPSTLNSCLARSPVFSDDLARELRASNDKFPFDFTRDPLTFNVRLSLPIFNGLQREQRIQEATALRNDARYLVRAQELRTTADVTAAYRTLLTSYQTVRLQEQNAQAAREALFLAQERFRVGAATFVDVVQARADYERAETDHINAIYDFHQAYGQLESAVGRQLR